MTPPTRPGAAAPGEIAAARLAKLARYLEQQDPGPDLGRRARVARRLGINQSYLTKLMSGERASVGISTVDSVSRTVPIRRDYFTAPVLVPGAPVDMFDPAEFVLEAGTEDPTSGPTTVANARWQAAIERSHRFMEGVRAGAPSADEALAIVDAVLSEPVIAAAIEARDAADAESLIAGTYKLVALLSGPPPSLPGPQRFLRVRAVPGRALPWPAARNHFVGLRLAGPGDDASAIVHRVAGRSYVDAGPTSVPSEPYFQRALDRGDLHAT